MVSDNIDKYDESSDMGACWRMSSSVHLPRACGSRGEAHNYNLFRKLRGFPGKVATGPSIANLNKLNGVRVRLPQFSGRRGDLGGLTGQLA